ncbi:Gnl1, partial [Symbiodinium pilosum]
MPRSKGKMQKSSIKLGARIDKEVKGASGERIQAQTLDFRSAAAIPEFTLADPLAHASGKRVATNSGMKTTFAAESSLNVARRIKMACVPLGCVVEDDAAVAEELSIQTLDLSSRSRQLMPRRPAWSYEISSGRLHHREAQSFKKWLDDVQEMIQERGGYPPAYETNLQVWRQLWRVLERCYVAVAVLDARHPLLHLPPALVYHVSRTLRKPLVVVLNKLDAVEPENAVSWAKALSKVPGISAITGFSKEELHARAFGDFRF